MEKKEYLAGILNLILDFNSRQLNYCHWKSNIHLDRSLEGLTDLDLLVDASQENLFNQILVHHDIKTIIPSSQSQHPAIHHYLGVDQSSGNFFHLHVHYQLIVGEQFVKNYHIPVEKPMLEGTEYSLGEIAVPLPDRELVILLIRSLLKYRDRDAIKDMFSIKSPGIPLEIQEEIRQLNARTTTENLRKTITEEMNIISPGLVIEYLDILGTTPRKGWQLLKLRTRLRRELSKFQLRSRWRASASYYEVLIKRYFPTIFTHSNKKQLANGGQGIAFIGADGSGKSTLIRAIQKWLSWKLDVTRYYMGSQEPSVLTWLARLVAHTTNRVYHYASKKMGYEGSLSRSFRGIDFFARNIYDLGIARDRYHRYVEGKRKASAGIIVIYDRYPLQEIHKLMPERPMDGPRINNRSENKPGYLSALISKAEVDLYSKIQPPDHVFILDVSPEVSHIRKPDHDIDFVKKKTKAIKDFNKENLHFTEINADENTEEVLLKTKLKLWESL